MYAALFEPEPFVSVPHPTLTETWAQICQNLKFILLCLDRTLLHFGLYSILIFVGGLEGGSPPAGGLGVGGPQSEAGGLAGGSPPGEGENRYRCSFSAKGYARKASLAKVRNSRLELRAWGKAKPS